MAKNRVDPDVARLRSELGNATRHGWPKEDIDRIRAELRVAVLVAHVKRQRGTDTPGG
jgi:hypothetical protein